MVKRHLSVLMPTSSTVQPYWNCLVWKAEYWETPCREVSTVSLWLVVNLAFSSCCSLQCSDTVGWVTGRASGL